MAAPGGPKDLKALIETCDAVGRRLATADADDRLDAGEAIVTESTGFLGIGDLEALVDEDRPDLKFPPYSPRFPERVLVDAKSTLGQLLGEPEDA